VQTRSESAFAAAALSAGRKSETYSQILILVMQVFDSLNSTHSLTHSLTVRATTAAAVYHPMVQSHSSALRAALLAKLFAGNASVKDLKSSTTLVSSLLNSANCSMAPNCTALHRQACYAIIIIIIPNTCGSCVLSPQRMSMWEIDSSGNTHPPRAFHFLSYRCLLNISSRACLHPEDGSPQCGSLHGLPLGSGLRAGEDLTCPGNCSGKGRCVFMSVIVHQELHSCPITSAACRAMCLCGGDWGGSACSYSEREVGSPSELGELRHQVRSSQESRGCYGWRTPRTR
jgi:hypothetical protein